MPKLTQIKQPIWALLSLQLWVAHDINQLKSAQVKEKSYFVFRCGREKGMWTYNLLTVLLYLLQVQMVKNMPGTSARLVFHDLLSSVFCTGINFELSASLCQIDPVYELIIDKRW